MLANESALAFTDLLTSYGNENPPGMVFQEGADFVAWRQSFMAKLEELRGPVLPRAAFSVDTVDSTVCQGHTRHTLRIRVNALSDLPAFLLVPDELKPGEKRPGIVALHGHAKYGAETVVGMDNDEVQKHPYRAYGLDAVKAGYVVLAPAWWGWPGRDGHVERVGQRDKCNVIQMAASMYGLSVLSLHIQDGQAAIDAMASRPEVDAARIGCIGNSYGGRTAMWLSAFDERITTCVATGCMNTLRERSLKLSSCGIQYLPGLLRYGDVAEVFSLIAPRPLQLMAGEQDGLLNETDREAMYETVRIAYAAADAEANLDYALHPEGHRMVWDLAQPFLDKHLM